MRGLLERIGLVTGRDPHLGTIYERLAVVHGDRRLVTEHGSGIELTYREAAERVDRWAGAVRIEASPGDRVVVAMPNGYEQVLACVAVARAGAVPAPVNDKMRDDEVRHVVGDAEAAFVIRGVEDLKGGEPLGQAESADPGDLAALFYTSGTTGKPKGVQLSHRALAGQVGAGSLWPGQLRRDEAVFGLPVAHIMGFAAVLAMASLGIPVYFLPRFRPDDVLDAIEHRRATVFVGVPTMYRLLLDAGAEERDLTSIRVWATGADAMPTELARRFKKMGATATVPLLGPVGEATMAEGYGMVEVGGGVAFKLSPPFLPVGLGEGLGIPLRGYRMRVVDDDGGEVGVGETGELWVKGPGVLEGYFRSPEATANALTDDGWLRTGDLARRGPLGVVSFAGRQKDVIIRGGYTIFPKEIEEVLEAHPAVGQAAVVGLPDERAGEVPAAAVVPTDGRQVDTAELEHWAGERLSDYKLPARWAVVDDLPRTGSDKVQRNEVRALFAD